MGERRFLHDPAVYARSLSLSTPGRVEGFFHCAAWAFNRLDADRAVFDEGIERGVNRPAPSRCRRGRKGRHDGSRLSRLDRLWPSLLQREDVALQIDQSFAQRLVSGPQTDGELFVFGARSILELFELFDLVVDLR